MILTRPHLKHPPTCARQFYAVDPAYVTLGKPASLNFANNAVMSVECWANTFDPGVNRTIFAGGYDGQTAYQLASGAGTTSFASYDGTVHQASAAVNLSSAWAHVYGDYDGAAWHIYIGGVLQAASVDAVGPIARPEKASVGAVYISGAAGQTWNGSIARVTVRNVALQPAEVAQLAAGASPATVRRGAGLVFWWQPKTVSGPDIDLIGGVVGIVTVGTAIASYPFQFQPRTPA